MKTLDDLKNIKGKTVLLRLDLNVPVDEKGQVTDTTRIDRVKETVSELKDKQAKVVILSHFGRPKGQKDDDYTLAFLPSVLQKQWGIDVAFIDECCDSPSDMDGNVVLMENIRFYEGEEKNDNNFSSYQIFYLKCYNCLQ